MADPFDAEPPYPLQPNGRPDLSGVPAFGRNGFEAFLREFGPDLALDAASLAAGPVGGPIVRGAAATPKLSAALMAGLGLGATSSQAGKADDPRIAKLQALDQEIAGHRAKLEKMATTNFQSKVAREAAQQPFLDAIKQAGQRKAALESEMDAEEKALQNSSFAKAHPVMNELWPYIQWGGPVVASMLTKGAGNMAERGMTEPWRKAVASAERAMDKGNAQKLAYEAGKAEQHLALEPSGAVGGTARWVGNKMREAAIPTISGAGVGMEAALFPYQYDRRNAPEGSPERLVAEKALGEDFVSSAMKGLAPGVLGGFTGAHLPNISPGYRPVAESRNLAQFLKNPAPTEMPALAPRAPVAPARPAAAVPEPLPVVEPPLPAPPPVAALPPPTPLPEPAAAPSRSPLSKLLRWGVVGAPVGYGVAKSSKSGKLEQTEHGWRDKETGQFVEGPGG